MTNSTVSNENTEVKGFNFDGLLNGFLNASDTVAEIGMTVTKAAITVTEEIAALGIDNGSQIIE
jgi:hypothetical protein